MPDSFPLTNDPLSTQWPALLVPVRLETRRVDDTLCVRVYPDQPSIDTHREALSRAEYDMGLALRDLIRAGDLGESARGEWKELARRYGPSRASWILEELLQGVPAPTSAELSTATPKPILLPARFVFFLYIGNELAYSVAGADVADDLNILPVSTDNIAEAPRPDGLFDERSRWISDFDAAIAAGLAVRIPLARAHAADPKLRFTRIVVVGARSPRRSEVSPLAQLVRSHRHTQGFEFLPYGTPTNNTLEASSGHSDSEDDLLGSFDYEVATPLSRLTPERLRESAYAEVSRALGLFAGATAEIATEAADPARATDAQALAHVKGADANNYQPVAQIFQALWPCTADYFISTMLGYDKLEVGRTLLMKHARRYLRPRGPLATVRIGKQPYGILPATRIRSSPDDPSSWMPWMPDSVEDPTLGQLTQFEEVLHTALGALLPRWLEKAADSSVVPRINGGGDVDEEILQILGMLPHSAAYRSRPIVDQTLIGVLLLIFGARQFGSQSSFAGLADPQAAMAAWVSEKERISAATLALLEMMGAPTGRQGSRLLRAFAWGDGTRLDMPLVRDPANPMDGPEQYLPHLRQNKANALSMFSKTLLYDLIRRSYVLAPRLPESLAAVDAALDELRDPVLEYFNGAVSPDSLQQLAERAPRPDVVPDEDGFAALVASLTPDGIANAPFASVGEITPLFGAYPGLWPNLVAKLWREFDRPLEMALRDVIDALTCRLDAWYTSLATARLERMRTGNPAGLHWGAYGYLEDVDVARDSGRQAPAGGYIHAPSVAHASAAAILRSAYRAHRDDEDGDAYALNLTSERVERALALIDGVQEGQDLPALLGYQFERRLHDVGLDRVIDSFRRSFPISKPAPSDEAAEAVAESISARRVCDGRALADAYGNGHAAIESALSTLGGEAQTLRDVLAELSDASDAVGDLLLFEGVYQAVQGNFERSGAALDACAGIGRPPEIECVATPAGGVTLRHRVCLLLPAAPTAAAVGARAAAEPDLNAWLGSVLGPLSDIGCRAYLDPAVNGSPYAITLDQLSPSISHLDFLHMCAALPTGTGRTEIELLLRRRVRSLPNASAASTIRLALNEASSASTVADAMEVGRALLDFLGSASPLTPESLAHPEELPSSPFHDEAELSDLIGRADAAWNLLSAQQPLLESQDPPTIRLAFDGCAGFGIDEALVDVDDETGLAKRVRAILPVLRKRLDAASALLEAARPGAPGSGTVDERIEGVANAFKALFGDSFVVLRPFKASEPAGPPDTTTVAQPPGEDRVWLWLEQVAETHPRVRRFETALMMTQAWRPTAAASGGRLEVAQLTSSAQRGGPFGWQALADRELVQPAERISGAQSIVAMRFGPIDPMRLAGFVVDEWTETMAASTVPTGISFEHDQPASQAPQCLLLAVPGNFKNPAWTPEHLAAIVSDTMDLAKTRLVDLDALPAVAGVFPALMFPIGFGLPTLAPIRRQPFEEALPQ